MGSVSGVSPYLPRYCFKFLLSISIFSRFAKNSQVTLSYFFYFYVWKIVFEWISLPRDVKIWDQLIDPSNNPAISSLFSDHIGNMEGKSSTQMGRFLNPMFAKCFHVFTDVLSCLKFFWNSKMFVWTRRMQFWQPCRTFSAKSPKMNIKLSFFQKDIFFLEKYSSKKQ